MRVRTGLRLVPALALLLVPTLACAPQDDDTAASDSSSSSPSASSSPSSSTEPSDAVPTATASEGALPAECAPDSLALRNAGTLTVGTDSPAYEPWFVDDDPTNGQGFESALAYALADELGFGADEVTWVTVPFNTSYKPGAKDFDFDINQISITPARAEVVDFSTGYYSASQAIIALEGSPLSEALTLGDLASYRLGAQTGTTSLTAIREVIKPETEAVPFEDTNAAKQALLNDQVDGIIADLPSAFYITSAEIDGSTIVGQFQPAIGEQEEFGMLFEKGSELVTCVDAALDALRSSGELDALQQQWLSDVVDVPVIY